MRVLPSYAKKPAMTEISAVHIIDDTHYVRDGASAAMTDVKPDLTPPRSKSRRSRKAASPATHPAKPIAKLPGDNSEGHFTLDTQRKYALNGRAIRPAQTMADVPDRPIRDGQSFNDTQGFAAVAGDGYPAHETQNTTVIATIQELWRRRQTLHRAEKSLTLQAKAICRRYVGGDKDEADKLFATVTGQLCSDAHEFAAVTVAIFDLMMPREIVKGRRLAIEKELAELAKTLPVYPWWEAIRGVGAMSLATLTGECGDIGSYKSASAVWKRMGLAVVNGERQRRVTGPDALLHGYSPQRRSVAWNIGVAIMRSQKAGQPLRDYYDSEKAKQLAKGLTKGHAHNRACRHMTKRLLAELYGAWRMNGSKSCH